MSALPRDHRAASNFALCGRGVPACLTEWSHRRTLVLLSPGQTDALKPKWVPVVMLPLPLLLLFLLLLLCVVVVSSCVVVVCR